MHISTHVSVYRLLEPALTKKQLDDLFNGKHTHVKFSKASTGAVNKFLKVLHTVTSYSEYTLALTFQNVCQGKMGSFFKPKNDDAGAGKSPEKQREQDKQQAAQRAAEDVCRACQAQSAGEWLCSNKSCDNLFRRLRKLDW